MILRHYEDQKFASYHEEKEWFVRSHIKSHDIR